MMQGQQSFRNAKQDNESRLFMMWHDLVYNPEPHYLECQIPNVGTAKSYVEARHICKCVWNGTPYLLSRLYTQEEVKAYESEVEKYKAMHLDMRDQIITAEDGCVGLQDVCGKTIIPPLFDGIPERYSCFERSSQIPVVKDGRYYLYDYRLQKLATGDHDGIFRYFGAHADYFVVEDAGKKGIIGESLSKDEIAMIMVPAIMDEVYEMIDPDGCIPFTKDGKWGLFDTGLYVAPRYDRLEVWSEDYVKVWLHGQQGWIDSGGQFTLDKSKAAVGSWYDAFK